MDDLFNEEEKILMGMIANANKGEEINYDSSENIKQGSKEWFKLRLGKFTGSKFPDLMKKGRSKDDLWGETAIKVIRQVAIERDLSDAGIDMYVEELFNKEFAQTRWGNKWESYARELYCEKTGNDVEETNFMIHEKYNFIGGSFDGKIIGQPGIIEIKCPYDMLVHDDNLNIMEEVDSQNAMKVHTYYPQIQGNIFIAGAEWCDFVSYDPRRTKKQLAIVRVERDDDFINRLSERIFIAEGAVNYINKFSVDPYGSILLSTKDLLG